MMANSAATNNAFASRKAAVISTTVMTRCPPGLEERAEHVLDRDESNDDARVIHDAGEMRALLAEQRDHLIARQRGGHAHERAQQRLDGGRRTGRDVPMHQVLDAEDADDVLARAAEGREPAERTGRDDVERVRPRRRDINHRQAIARDHQVASRRPAEPQRLLEPLLLIRLEQPAIAALRDEQRNLVG